MADALIDGGFVDATPLWFYVLKEAEVQGQGQHLGEVGSRIVCTTLIGQIQADPDSYLNRPGGAWTTVGGRQARRRRRGRLDPHLPGVRGRADLTRS